MEKNHGERRWEGQPGAKEVRTVLGKLHLRGSKDGCHSACKSQVWNSWGQMRNGDSRHGRDDYGSSSGECMGRHSVLLLRVSVETIAWSPRGSLGWRSCGGLSTLVHVWLFTHSGYITRDNQEKGNSHSRMGRKYHFLFPFFLPQYYQRRNLRERNI